MSAVRSCVVCEKPLDDDKRPRADTATCSKRCRTALWRTRRKIRREGGVPFVSVTRDGYGGVASFEPPRPSFLTGSRADERFRRQLARGKPGHFPTAEERQLLQRQRRNGGVMLPQLQQRLLDHEYERRRVEAADHQAAIKVEDPLDPSSRGSLAHRAIQSRNRNRPQAPGLHVLRPPGRQSGAPWDDLPSMADSPQRNTPRWAM